MGVPFHWKPKVIMPVTVEGTGPPLLTAKPRGLGAGSLEIVKNTKAWNCGFKSCRAEPAGCG